MGAYAKALLYVSTCDTNGSIYSSISKYFSIVYIYTVWLIQHMRTHLHLQENIPRNGMSMLLWCTICICISF